MENFILTMENWGTYRQTDGPLQVYNYQERQIETLASFGLDDIPRADALLLFDSHFRAAGYAAEIVMRHEQKYGNKPEFLTCGGHSNKGASANDGKTQAEWYEHMFLSWGFDEEWVLKNHINSQSTSNRMNIREIRRMLICSPVLNKIRRPDILVVTGCGYTLRAAQELGFAFPDCRLHFYETPVTPVDKRYFDYEAFNGNGIGWGIDTVLATMLHCMRFWGTERLALPPEKAKKAPDVNMIRQILLNGYALYYPSPDMWEYLDVNSRQGLALCRQRRLELFGTDDTEYPRRKGTLQYIEKRLKTHIGRLIDEKASEFAAKALRPSSFR